MIVGWLLSPDCHNIVRYCLPFLELPIKLLSQEVVVWELWLIMPTWGECPQVVSIKSSPVFSFLVFPQLPVSMRLSYWMRWPFMAFVLVAFLRKKKPRFRKRETVYRKDIFRIWKMDWTISGIRKIFFLLLVASSVNFFCGFWVLLPFSESPLQVRPMRPS